MESLLPIITFIITLLLLIITSVITSLLHIITCSLLPIITVIMGSLLLIITRSIMGNNGSIITHYRPPQLGDAGSPSLPLPLQSFTHSTPLSLPSRPPVRARPPARPFGPAVSSANFSFPHSVPPSLPSSIYPPNIAPSLPLFSPHSSSPFPSPPPSCPGRPCPHGGPGQVKRLRLCSFLLTLSPFLPRQLNNSLVASLPFVHVRFQPWRSSTAIVYRALAATARTRCAAPTPAPAPRPSPHTTDVSDTRSRMFLASCSYAGRVNVTRIKACNDCPYVGRLL